MKANLIAYFQLEHVDKCPIYMSDKFLFLKVVVLILLSLFHI